MQNKLEWWTKYCITHEAAVKEVMHIRKCSYEEAEACLAEPVTDKLPF